MKSAEEWCNAIFDALLPEPNDGSSIIPVIRAIQADAKATGRAEGLREALEIVGEGCSEYDCGSLVCKALREKHVAILAAIDRKEGMTNE